MQGKVKNDIVCADCGGMNGEGMRRNRAIYRAFLIVLLLFTVAGGLAYYLYYIEQNVPDRILLTLDEGEKLDFGLPVECEGIDGEVVDAIQVSDSSKVDAGKIHFSLSRPVTVKAVNEGSYRTKLKLFGLFNYKDLEFKVVKGQKVMPSGKAVGLYINADGVMVLGTSEIEGKDGVSYEPAKNVLQSGDYIYKVNGKAVTDIEQVSDALQKTNGKNVTLKLRRGKNEIDVKLKPVMASDGIYKIGAWLREDTEGIGTVTYVSSNNMYAALGHGITDVDTGLLISIKDGGVFPATIREVVAGKSGEPGEILGSVALGQENKIGTIKKNTPYGIAGNISGADFGYNDERAVEVGLKQDVKKGDASILCQLGDNVEEYDIKIETVRYNNKDNKGMVIHVTDKRLLNKAGGIVQGMSGSPILQNGKIIGAVTHVFVNDSTRGYGIFIEDMLEQ